LNSFLELLKVFRGKYFLLYGEKYFQFFPPFSPGCYASSGKGGAKYGTKNFIYVFRGTT